MAVRGVGESEGGEEIACACETAFELGQAEPEDGAVFGSGCRFR